MKYCWTTLHVKNMNDSIHFYENIVGLSIQRRTKLSPEFELAFLGSGETQVELICDSSDIITPIGKNVSIGFQVESLDEFMGFLVKKGIDINDGPFQPNSGIKFLYVLDPNGLKIQFIEFLELSNH